MARLNALPYATMCIECQRASENGTLEDRRVEDWGRVIDTGYADVDASMSDFEVQYSGQFGCSGSSRILLGSWPLPEL